MKKTRLLIARCLTLLVLALLSTNLAWGADKTYSFTPDATTTGSSATAYVETAYAFTYNEIGWSFNQWNPKTLQIKTNQSSAGSEFNFKNTSAFPGKIKSVVITFSALTVSDASKLCFVGGTSAISSLSGGSAGTWNSTAQTLTWTPADGTNYTYFAFYQNGKAASGTNNLAESDAIVITYEDGTTPSKELVSLAVSGTPDKTNYKSNEEFDPAGLTVIGTYDDASTAPITSGIEWTVTPSGALTVGTTSVSVTATVNEITSSAYVVNGLTVEEFVQTYANTYTSNVELTTTGGTSASAAKVVIGGTEYDAIKAGTGSAAGAVVVTIPANTKTLHFHAAGWNGETVVLNETINLVADAGVSNSSPFTLKNDPETQDYFTIDPQGATSITFTATSGKRFVLFGVNAEESKEPSISADVEEIVFDQKELSGTVTDSKTISATGKNLTAAISASMKSGSNAVFSVTPVGTPTAAAGEFTVSYSATEVGEYAGTVVLSSGETSLEIPVSASVVAHIPVLQSIYVNGEPAKKEYYVGDAFETAGLEVWGKYDEGADKQITEGIEWEVTPATFSATTETSVSVVAKALEKTSEAFVVSGLTVAAAPQIATYDFTTNLYGHTGVSSGTDNHDGDIAVNEIFTESPTQIKFIKSGSAVTRFWSNKGISELRIYKDAEFTISSTYCNIIKVEFAGTVNLKVGETKVSNKTWTGKQKSVTFGNDDSNSALTSITVTYAVAGASVPVTINDFGQEEGNASFCCAFDLDFTDTDVKAYIAVSADNDKITLNRRNKIPAGTGIFVIGSSGNHNIPIATGDLDDVDDNMLTGTLVDYTVQDDDNIWALSKTDGKLYYIPSGRIIGAGKAYLNEHHNTASLSLFISDEPTGINSINENVNENENLYNLQGIRVTTPKKGEIYIMNGKKFLMK